MQKLLFYGIIWGQFKTFHPWYQPVCKQFFGEHVFQRANNICNAVKRFGVKKK